MKKFLLGTTALASFAASAAFAGGSHTAADGDKAAANKGGLTVMVGGFVNAEHALVDQANNAGDTGVAGNERDVHFTNDAEIHITAAGSTENFDYGAVTELNATIDGDKRGDGNQADKVFLFVEGDNFGRVEFGGNSGASQTLEIDASNIARATGGVDGNWVDYVDTTGISKTAGAVSTADSFITAPNLIVADDDATATDASKITYYTPRFGGVQLGVSYTPDTGDLGTALNLSQDNNAGNYSDVFAGGINYQGNFDGVGLSLAAVGESGKAEAAAVEDLQAYSLGGQVSVEGFSVAGNWADLGESGLATTATNKDQTYWTAGAAYENGPYGVSATYFESESGAAAGNNTVTNTSVGADYQLAPGLKPYVEASFFELDPAGTATAKNNGSVVLLGAELAF